MSTSEQHMSRHDAADQPVTDRQMADERVADAQPAPAGQSQSATSAEFFDADDAARREPPVAGSGSGDRGSAGLDPDDPLVADARPRADTMPTEQRAAADRPAMADDAYPAEQDAYPAEPGAHPAEATDRAGGVDREPAYRDEPDRAGTVDAEPAYRDEPARTEPATGTGTAATAPSGTAGTSGTAPAAPATDSDSEAGEAHTPLISSEYSEQYSSRWNEVKGMFVDEPRAAVRQADELVGQVLSNLEQLFREQRQGIEQGLDNDDTSTEDLRMALRRYRSFFERLLSV